jgi:glutaredoxin
MSRLADRIRARGYVVLERVPGKVGKKLRGVNEALGRPLAGEHELADRRAFHAHAPQPQATRTQAAAKRDVAPVIVYHMDKQRRDVPKLTEILDANGIPYKVMNIQEDPAAQYAVRRDSKGQRLPVVFVAGECVGSRTELINLISDGGLKKKVFGEAK